MTIQIIRTNGTIETIKSNKNNVFKDIEKAINADVLDSFKIRNNRRVWVNDMGHPLGLPLNREATKLYHEICIPGTTNVIVGDVAITPDW